MQHSSTACWTSSSRRLSNRPSLPKTSKSPCCTGVVLTMAPWITVCAFASLKPWSRCTCTGLRVSYRPGTVLKICRKRKGQMEHGRSTKRAQSPRLAVTRFEPRSVASNSVVAPYACVLSNERSMSPVSHVPSSVFVGRPLQDSSFSRQHARRSRGSSSGGMPRWATPETPSQMPRCIVVSITASALTMPLLAFAGCCFEAQADTNRKSEQTAAVGGGIQEKLGCRVPTAFPSTAGGTHEKLGLAGRKPATVSVTGGAHDKLWTMGLRCCICC
mmetsp:Transcript_117796/g.234690  ORF Transcript_117796/g.234690 Transcript_117796/m.234690 type:complete len:273 (-) Transcript_117796:1260-2078(-)